MHSGLDARQTYAEETLDARDWTIGIDKVLNIVPSVVAETLFKVSYD